MFNRRFFAEAATLLVLAAICGTVANVVAARDRKLAAVGSYPNALVVPAKATPQAPAEATPVTETATETVDPTKMTVPEPDATSPGAEPDEPMPVELATTQPTSTPPPSPAKPAPKPRKQFAPTPDKVSVDITNADAMQLFEDGALFLDARRSGAYAEGHIPGARSFAVWEADVDDKVMALFSELTDQRQPIVVYCTGGNCEDSHMLAQKLWGIGYENVLVYTDGFPGWLSVGGAVER